LKINRYKCLNKQIFKENEFRIIPIRLTDRFKIMKWRNEQIYHLRQKEKLTKSKQDLYFKDVIKKQFSQANPDQILFSFFHKNVFIGYGGLVHINWKKQNAEISFIMDTDLEKIFFKKYWSKFLILIEKVAFYTLDFKKIFVYAYDVRSHLYPILTENNYKLNERKKNDYTFNNKYLDALIYTKFNCS
tara:strand:+ start:9777 stop:10340 length:564 start_codon:yes stop_codon:yes gene_type:complete